MNSGFNQDSIIKPPVTEPLSNILPNEPLLLMGAGPVPISHAVSRANGVVINHLGDDGPSHQESESNGSVRLPNEEYKNHGSVRPSLGIH